jgi:putative transposase
MESVLYVCRRLWNYFLEQKITAYKTAKKHISRFDQIKEIPVLALKDESLREVYSQVLRDAPCRLDMAFQAFFRRVKQGGPVGFPRFKGADRYNSFTYPQNNGSFKLMEKDKRIYLSKIGCVKMAYHREAKGVWKKCMVKRTSTGKWYVVIVSELPDVIVKKSTNPAVGIDLGLKEFAVLSDSSKIKRARFFKAEKKALAGAQRKLAKQIMGTSERGKVKKVVARVHERITNKRNDFTHQQSHKIANKYGIICLEDLNVKGMLEKASIVISGVKQSAKPVHRGIADVAWSQFVSQLKYKAEEAGSSVVLVNPKNTTKMCSACGKLAEKDLSQREYVCPCGHTEDRDLNASKNILRLGLQSLTTLQKVA